MLADGKGPSQLSPVSPALKRSEAIVCCNSPVLVKVGQIVYLEPGGGYVSSGSDYTNDIVGVVVEVSGEQVRVALPGGSEAFSHLSIVHVSMGMQEIPARGTSIWDYI